MAGDVREVEDRRVPQREIASDQKWVRGRDGRAHCRVTARRRLEQLRFLTMFQQFEWVPNLPGP